MDFLIHLQLQLLSRVCFDDFLQNEIVVICFLLVAIRIPTNSSFEVTIPVADVDDDEIRYDEVLLFQKLISVV